ncbi:hypothetical protein EVA_16012 [gut metagenome]|uniref:Uncharacterized protein n=1 Tax=gut metagenome TaxID=749906 RepID=J9C7P4_9ZZZZ
MPNLSNNILFFFISTFLLSNLKDEPKALTITDAVSKVNEPLAIGLSLLPLMSR